MLARLCSHQHHFFEGDRFFMAEATGTQGQYKVTTADVSSPDSISEAYNRAAAQGEIASSVWDGTNVNIVIED
jgi:hypothetical protein